MKNEKIEEVKEDIKSEEGDELIPVPDEIAPESSPEQKPEGEVVETPPKGAEPEKVEVNPLEQYISELEKEVGTRRGENETPEAYALRLEVTKLKRERKTERKELFEKPETVIKETPKGPEEDLLSGYNQEEVSNFEKLFDVVAKRKGLVRKDELQATTWEDKAQDILEDFQTKHKEYNDDTLWTQFKDEFQSGKYNTRPQNPKLLTEIFEEIHRKLVPQKMVNRPAVAAGKEKIQAAAHGGTTIPPTPRKPIDPVLKEALKGFTEEELEELSQ